MSPRKKKPNSNTKKKACTARRQSARLKPLSTSSPKTKPKSSTDIVIQSPRRSTSPTKRPSPTKHTSPTKRTIPKGKQQNRGRSKSQTKGRGRSTPKRATEQVSKNRNDTLTFHLWLQILKKYKEKKGHADVPYDKVATGGYRLGRWVANMRRAYALIQVGENPRRKLSKMMMDSLTEIGFDWKFDETKEVAFYVERHRMEYATKLARFKFENKHLDFPKGSDLKTYFDKVQCLYSNNRLSESTYSIFSAQGFCFLNDGGGVRDKWFDEGFSSYSQNRTGRECKKWVEEVKRRCVKGTLEESQLIMLTSVGFPLTIESEQELNARMEEKKRKRMMKSTITHNDTTPDRYSEVESIPGSGGNIEGSSSKFAAGGSNNFHSESFDEEDDDLLESETTPRKPPANKRLKILRSGIKKKEFPELSSSESDDSSGNITVSDESLSFGPGGPSFTLLGETSVGAKKTGDDKMVPVLEYKYGIGFPRTTCDICKKQGTQHYCHFKSENGKFMCDGVRICGVSFCHLCNEVEDQSNRCSKCFEIEMKQKDNEGGKQAEEEAIVEQDNEEDSTRKDEETVEEGSSEGDDQTSKEDSNNSDEEESDEESCHGSNKKYTKAELDKMDLATLRSMAKENKVEGYQKRTIVRNLVKLWE